MTGRAPVPDVLRTQGLVELWRSAREQMERRGVLWRGRIGLPDLGAADLHALTSLLGRRPPQHLNFRELEPALVALGIGADLDAALTALGAPASSDRAARREATARRRHVANVIEDAALTWPETWAADYGRELLRSGRTVGLDADTAHELLGDVRRVLDALLVAPAVERPRVVRRSDLAAELFGSAHALDDGVLRERCIRLALCHHHDLAGDTAGREVWSAAGVESDLVSSPVLTWNLQLNTGTQLGEIAAIATDSGVPVHLTAMALRLPIAPASTAPVFLVENPRLVEAAAEQMVPWSVISTNGNPTTAVLILVDALVAAGTLVRHHGDFDAAGIAIVRRLAARGSTPWLMGARDYVEAIDLADQAGVTLPRDTSPCGATPWDRALSTEFDRRRSVVHEERLIDVLLDPELW